MAAAAQLHYASESEAEMPYDAEYQPDHTLLLGGCLCVVMAAYMLVSVLPWPWLQRNGKSNGKQRHRVQVDEASARPASPLRRPPSPECTQTSPRRAAAAAPPAAAAAAEPAATLQTDFVSAISDHAPGRPFRFRAPDFDADGAVWASPDAPAQKQQQQQQQQQMFSTPPPSARRQQRREQQQQQQPEQQEPESSWEPALLSSCAAASPYIGSVEALQRSPAFRSHISQVRGRRLNYETAESHKLRVYKALREVDPPSFQQLFSRQDVQEYDEVPPSRLMSAFDCLASSALTLGLLALPWLLPSLASYRAAAAATWAALTLLAAAHGYTSPAAALLRVHATEGPYNMLPPLRRLLLAAAAEAGLVVLTCGLGVVVSLGFRLLSRQRQGFGDRLCRFVPLREVVRPMHFSAMPSGAAAAAAAIARL
uniref:Uncharacterized protein n=3 Tax=Tetradesmus obliquus TaxID=3088 RepID=A0A383WLQ8_TETOB|eukprot:jgi/Sobl393_1/6312/SZX78385.1